MERSRDRGRRFLRVDPPADQGRAIIVDGAARALAVHRLLSAGVLTGEDLVDRGVTVRDSSRANQVLLVQVDAGGSGVAVKTLAPERLAGELAVHELVAARSELAAVVPRLLAADPEAGWLAIELVVPGTTLTSAHRSSLGYPLALGQAAGRALGIVHRATRDLPTWPAPSLPWPFFALEPDGLGAFAWEEPPLRALLDRVADLTGRRAALAVARSTWRPECLVHGDLKWDNLLLVDGGGTQPEVALVDWELAGFGDPAWDIAGIVQEYVSFASLTGLDLAARRQASAVEIAAVGPLAAALRAFFTAYATAACPDDVGGLAHRAVRFAGVRLLQTSLEHASAGGPQTRSGPALLDLALAMIEEPVDLAGLLQLTADL